MTQLSLFKVYKNSLLGFMEAEVTDAPTDDVSDDIYDFSTIDFGTHRSHHIFQKGIDLATKER